MDHGRSHRVGDDSSSYVMATTPTHTQRFQRYEPHQRHVSTMDEMSMIPESEVATFAESSTARNHEFLLHQHGENQPTETPSLLRRLTRRLSPRIPSPAIIQSTIPLRSLRSLRRPAEPGYENLDDGDDDQGSIPVDLSVLSGLGFEVVGNEQSGGSQRFDQDTAYRSPGPESAAPDFQSFVRRSRELGTGLVVGANIRRDPSIRRRNTPDTRAEEIRRNRTVRNTAQDIAKKGNMIVAVTEPVDLSLLEGPDVRQMPSPTFDGGLNRTTTLDNMPLSYYFPRDPDVPNWRPKTMSTPYILFLMAGAFTLAGCQEYLCQKSQRLEDENSGILAFDDVDDVSIGVFFVWKYLPTMITIIYAVLFSIMDFDIRRLEPFYQLSQPLGSPASESLNVDHLTTFQYLVPFKALRLKQWTVFFSTIGNIIASTASPALQNPSVDFDTNASCEKTANDIKCPEGIQKYVVLITPMWSRFLSTSYIIMGIICIILFFQLRRKSGLLSDPKGIAGIASMATKSHILRDFNGTDLATRKDIQKRLAHRRFILYKSSIWQGQWNVSNPPQQESEARLSSPHPPMLRLTACYPFVIAQVLCLIAVPVISLTRANVIPNTVPWLPILIATILKLVWSTFEADVRLMEPFYQLSRGNATPERSLTLDYQSSIYGILPFKAAFNGHWLLCIVGLCSVALDVLSVTVSSFSIQADLFYNQITLDPVPSGPELDSTGDETKVSFWVSVILSMVILMFVIFTTILVYLRRRHPFLPREPSTIASILAFIYASNMLEDFIDTERLTNKQMESRLKKVGKKYALGWFRGRDGQIHCAIDQEPIRSRYVHGLPYYDAMAGPVDIHGGYHA